MDLTPLDNPALHALSGRHDYLALGQSPVLRYPAEVSPFAALETPDALPVLGSIMHEGDTAVLWSPHDLDPPKDLELVIRFPCLQMAAFDLRAAEVPDDVPAMTPADAPDMVDLAALTRPGPFHLRTIEMGSYIGIRIDGRLAAMAGERMKPGPFTEVSAICVHPDFQGRGLARRLTSIMARRVVADGRTPFLNVLPENRPAIALYESLGFVPRRMMQVHLLRKPGGETSEDAFFSSL